MKKILVLTMISIVFMFGNIQAQIDNITPTSLKLKGKVKSMSETSYEIKGKWENPDKMKIKGKKYNDSYFFSEKQLLNLKVRSSFDREAKDTLTVWQKEINVYNENGDLIKELEVMGYPDPVKTADDWDSNISLVTYYHTYVYEGDKLVSKNHVNPKENTDHVERKYVCDSKNNVTMVKYFSHSGVDTTVKKREVFNYNAEGWKEEYILYQIGDVENERIKYNSKGLVIYKKYIYTSYGAKQFTETFFEYNEKGQIIKVEAKETKDGVEGTPTITTFTYNDQGDMDAGITINKDGTKYEWKYIYKYDSNNNWICYYTYSINSKDISTFNRRVISYY